MGLYRKTGVNPMSGCIPMIIQMPILLAVFRFFPSSIDLRHKGFLWAEDLSSYDAIVSWATEIPLLSRDSRTALPAPPIMVFSSIVTRRS